MAVALDQVTQGDRLSSRRDGSAVLHEVAYRPGAAMPAHSHRAANITLLIGGDLEESIEGAGVVARTLSVVLKPSGVEHSTTIGPRGMRSFVVELDQRTERRLRRRTGLFDRCRWIEDPRLAFSMAGLWASVQDSVSGGAVRAWIDDLPRLLAETDARVDALRAGWSESLGRAVARLEREHDHPLGPADLAGEMRLHPSSVTRLFTRALGGGVKACLRGIRVRRAADQLALSEVPLPRIALNHGFCDQAHLCREFRRTLGVTPGAYRRLARG